LKYPPITLEFLRALTDDTGILQHAKFGTPKRNEGYTTDDNARALVALTKYSQKANNFEKADSLVDVCLSFLLLMQNKDGTIHNYLSYNRNFMDDKGSEDSMGRTLLSCGCVVDSNLSLERRLLAKEIFDKLLPWAFRFTAPRAKAFAVMGLRRYQKAFAEDRNPTKNIKVFAEHLLEHYANNNASNWHWFEPYLTYSNGRLPQALFEAYEVTRDKRYLEAASESMNFLLKVQTIDGIFVPIGNSGWYNKGEDRAMYDQQSVEAATMTEAVLSAYQVTGQRIYKKAAERIFNWFFGENTLRVQVYNSDLGGCCDGITPLGLNLNMGAEATVCYLSAIVELETQSSRPIGKIMSKVF
jgi:hypothetical protein